MYSDLTYDVMKSYLTRVWDKKIRNGNITLEKKGCYEINRNIQMLRYIDYLYLICYLKNDFSSANENISWCYVWNHLIESLSMPKL